MMKNSTLFFILDGNDEENEIIDIDEMLDPAGKYNAELDSVLRCIDFSPRQEVIEKILKNA
jgi:hypothetical protein